MSPRRTPPRVAWSERDRLGEVGARSTAPMLRAARAVRCGLDRAALAAACSARSLVIAVHRAPPVGGLDGQHRQVLVVGQVQPGPGRAVGEGDPLHRRPSGSGAGHQDVAHLDAARRRRAPAAGPAAAGRRPCSTPSSTIATWSASRKYTPVGLLRSTSATTTNSASTHDRADDRRTTISRAARPHVTSARASAPRRSACAVAAHRRTPAGRAAPARCAARPGTPRRPCPRRPRGHRPGPRPARGCRR